MAPNGASISNQGNDSSLGVLEQVSVRCADRQKLSAILQLQFQCAAKRAVDRIDSAHVDDDASVNLPKYVRVQLGLHLLERGIQQEAGGARVDRRVLVVGAQIRNLRNGEDS